MNNWGSTGIAAMPILISFLLIGGASSLVVFEGSDEMSEDADRIINDVIDEITTYLKIDDIVGKYYNTHGIRRVEKIVILVKQFIQNTINISELTIKICNNNDVILLNYSGHAVESTSSLFEHKVWEKTNDAFSLIVVLDRDRSLLDYNIMNEDTVFIAINLPDQFTMKDRDSITISIIPAKGIISTAVLETPSFHLSNIISFGGK
ncbi:MAG: hypothetical protein JSW62_00720 [Thermoplasmatales archaeon]|nr:MAG: hypothetical protein JSW62_00720 [Thermoplasmatales archaeon]